MTALTATLPEATERTGNPFDLADQRAYRSWRRRKLEAAARPLALIDVDDLNHLSVQEYHVLTSCCGETNFAIYRAAAPVDKTAIVRFGRQLGLRTLDANLCADEDRISTLQVDTAGVHGDYIPYTNRALNWHTDGYYNPLPQRIRAFILHCVQPAASGGANKLLDPELVYIALRDTNPEALVALMQPQTMTIPANPVPGAGIRGPRSGPVFSVDPATGALHMRYTARTRSVEWRTDAITQRARRLLTEILNDSHPYQHSWRLEAGQGMVCNNILHTRDRFVDQPARRRLLYRARFQDRIAGTHWQAGGRDNVMVE